MKTSVSAEELPFASSCAGLFHWEKVFGTEIACKSVCWEEITQTTRNCQFNDRNNESVGTTGFNV